MLRLNRRAFNLSLLATGAAVLAAPALTGWALAARPVLIASLLGQNKPETKVWLKIRDRVEGKLPGRFSFNIVPNAALGGEKDVNEGLRLGAIQGSLSTLSALSPGRLRASSSICRFSSVMPTMSARRSLPSPETR